MSGKKKEAIIITAIIAAVVIAIAAIVICCFNDYKDPRLKKIYSGKFDIGCAVPESILSDPKLLDIVREQFTIITPENALKPESVLDVNKSRLRVEETGDETCVEVHFDKARPILDFAKENRLKVHGHTLLWFRQNPEAFFHEGYDTEKPFVSREIMLCRLENYIKGVMSYLDDNYPGLVVSWDVVNEAVSDKDTLIREGFWQEVVGDDYIHRAFEYARKYAPEGTLLYYNDYINDVPNKQDKILKLLESLVAEGNIDGYGFQMHNFSDFPSMELVSEAFDNVKALGLRIRVSEMDIGVDDDSDISFYAQAETYAETMQTLIGYSDQLEAVQFWGLTDDMSWRSDEYPLMFDENGCPKPAFWAVCYPDPYILGSEISDLWSYIFYNTKHSSR